MKHWKTFAISCSTLLLAILFPFQISKSCGAYDEGPDGYFFLSHDVGQNGAEFTPYIMRTGSSYEQDAQARKDQRIENLKEWSSFACETENLDDIDAVIYTSTATDLDYLRSAARKGKITGRWAKNSFASGLVKSKCTETFDYLLFAKHCEPHAVAGASWDADRPFNSEVQELIDLGKKQLLRTDNHFLRMRYMYQIVRLAHYADDYNYALELYEDLDYKVDEVPSIIQWWLLGHKAGCLKKIGKNTEAAYLFSKVFKNSEGKREQSFRSFHIENDREWDNCMKLCESDEEQATLYVIRAMRSDSKVVEEMENIYRIFPTSSYLTPLLVKEISNIENAFTGVDFRRSTHLKKPDKVAKERLIRLQTFVKKTIDDGKIQNLPKWLVLQGYLEYLAGDLYAAEQSYETATPLVKDDEKLKEQLELFKLVHEIHSMERMNEETEERLYEIIKFNRFYQTVETLPDFINERMATLYEKQMETGKAFLCMHDLRDLRVSPDIQIINDLIAFAERPGKDRLEKYLLEEKLGKDYLSHLYEAKGTYHLSKYELPEANRAFSKVSPTVIEQKTYSPYYLPLKDCLHCKLPADSNRVEVNKKELVQQLLDFEYKAKTDLDNGAKYYYFLGSAYYNMSYYGHEYEILDNLRHSNSWNLSPTEVQAIVKKQQSKGWWAEDVDYTDVSKALFFFEKARALSKNDELAARASFMAAKCELAAFYQETDYIHWKNAPKLSEKYSNYYDLLIKKYQDTEFYKEAIKECSFFALYASNQ